MKKQTIICDRCGKDITGSTNYRNHLDITLEYWHGGSLGGIEDEDNFDVDLCDDCAQKLSTIIDKFLKNKI